MPSQPFDTGWDFSSVLDLIDADTHGTLPSLIPASQALIRAPSKSAEDEQNVHLGDFSKLFETLGLSNVEPLPPISPVDPSSEDPGSSDDTLLPPPAAETKEVSSAEEDAVGPSSFLKKLGEPVKDDPYAGMTRKQRHQARKKAEKERKAQKQLEKEFTEREKERKDLQAFVDSFPDTPTPNAPAPKQTRAQSRSNVGAKIRPTTPVELNPPVTIEKLATPTPKGILQRPTACPLVPPAQPFVPGRLEHALPHKPVANAAPTATPPYQHPSTPSETNNPHGYFTPLVPYGHSLVPRTVQPVIVQRPAQPVAVPQPGVVPPTTPVPSLYPVTPGRFPRAITIRPRVDRHLHFLNQLIAAFPEDRQWLVSPMQLCNEKTSTEGIHVFVDASNIMIGFRDILRENGIQQQFDMSFDSLALLMERRRPVAKRVFAGSHREATPLPHVTRLVETSKAVGYENNVKEQVFIRRDDTEKRKFFKDVKKLGWTKAAQRRSGSGSDSETGPAPTTPSAPKWVEQGVDELLHLKMCQSIIDAEVPTTMVLATGDGAEAEHSDGFLAQVERALKKGWRVELVSWKQQTSGGYKNKRFRAKWGDRFRIIPLDDYLESLIDTA